MVKEMLEDFHRLKEIVEDILIQVLLTLVVEEEAELGV
jgi:hypothetical protein